MTRKEYAAYQARFEGFCDRYGVHGVAHDGEPFFSWRPCEVCRTPLGGNRYDCTAFQERTHEVLEIVACSDCVYYSDRGELDDETMQSMERPSALPGRLAADHDDL